ncbi:hypothetical protein PSI19_05930 [Xenorhabdus khoisanae]|uniref:hypothetical protein n=1 Tax=Xenorhabdus khoisanae TaxID=880157 RepID=UPI00235A181B|nr:hypothetical protein [Xenorhabdus khoisanae]MDC9613433.1 hypothetical protein [Xenorhabdus khoisanae]
MSNDMIEQINATLESAEQLKSAGTNEITLDLDSYITILRRLAEYENMEPVAWGRHTGMNRTLDLTVLPERVTEWREFNEAHPDIADDIFPLYRHPNK